MKANDVKVIVGVLANDEDGYDKMVEASRKTCYESPPEHFEVFFIYGRRKGIKIPPGGSTVIDDCFYHDYPESRANILKKTVAFFEYCLKNLDFDYIFRANCGSYIDMSLLSEFLKDKPREEFYCGHLNGSKKLPPFVSGAGYFLSADIVKLIVDKKDDLEYNGRILMDDTAVGDFLHKRCIPITEGRKILSVNIDQIKGTERIAQHIIDRFGLDEYFRFDPECYHYHFRHTINPECFYEIRRLKK